MITQRIPQVALAVAVALIGSGCGQSAGKSENVPDIPIYPGAQLRESVTGEDLDPTEYYAIAGASADDVLEWYSDGMPDAGWEPNSTVPGADFVNYHTSEGCYGFVGVFEADDGSVELVVSQQRPGTRCYVYLTPDPSGGSD